MRRYRGRINRCYEFASGVLTETCHPEDSGLDAHAHSEGYRSVVLSGGYTEYVYGECPTYASRGDLINHNAGEVHGDFFRHDTVVLNIEVHSGHTLNNVLDEAAQFYDVDFLNSFLPDGSHQFSAPVPPWLSMLVHEFDWLDPRPLERAASVVALHPAHLSRAFKQHTGSTILAFRNLKRASFVATELVESSRPLAAIAFDARFSDQSHMAAVFSAQCGMTPHAFREAFAR